MNWIEIFGTSMSAIIAISLTQKKLFRLRILNLIGAIGFLVYGVLINSLPVIFLNGFISFINIYYLLQIALTKDNFKAIKFEAAGKEYIDAFFEQYIGDIVQFTPSFKIDCLSEVKGFFILREAMPVSIFLFEETSENDNLIILDYAIPPYRDTKNGQYFFNKYLKHGELSGTLTAHAETKHHAKYLKKMGFLKNEATDGITFTKKIE